MIYLLVWTLLSIPQIRDSAFTIDVSPISDHFYVHTSYGLVGSTPYPSNGLILETTAGVVVVDTPWDTAQSRQLFDWIEMHIKKEVILCIVTHAHDDRMGGIEEFARRGIRVISTPLTSQHAARQGLRKPEAVLPNDTLFTIGGVPMECFFPGKGHTDDNIVVWFPNQRILFGGCLVKSTNVGGLGNIADADLHAWPGSIRVVMKKFSSHQIVIPGHESWSNNNSLEHTLELLRSTQ